MKFVCDRCQTRYSIADDKVRQKILKIRCKTCSNVITVQESRALPETGPEATPTPPPPPVEWHLSVNGHVSGPFPLLALVKRIVGASAGDDVYVWAETLDGWKEPKDVGVVAAEVAAQRGRPLPPPPPPSRLPPPPILGAPSGPRAGSGLTNRSSLPPTGFGGGTAGRAQAPARGGSSGRIPKPGAPAAQAPPPGQAAPARRSHGGLPVAPAASLLGDDGERTAIQPFDASFLRAARAHPDGGAAAEESFALADLSIDTTENQIGPNGEGPTPRPSAGGPVTGLEGLDFGPPRVGAPLADLRSAGSFFPVDAAAGAGVAGPPPAAGMSTQLSGLSKLIPRPGFFARNPAMKYAVTAGLLVGLVIVVVLLGFRGEPDRKVAARPAGREAPAGNEDPEEAARREAEMLFKNRVGEAPPTEATVRRPEVGGRRPPPRPAPKAHAAATAAKPGPPALEPPPVAPSPPPVADDGSATRRYAPMERRVSKPAPGLRAESAGGRGGTFDQAAVSAVIRRRENQDAIKICYERALKRDQRLSGGRVNVTVTVGLTGTVRAVAVDAPGDLDAVSACVRETVKRWRFPPAGEEYDTQFPFVFQRDTSG